MASEASIGPEVLIESVDFGLAAPKNGGPASHCPDAVDGYCLGVGF